MFGVREFRIVELKRGSVVAINDNLAPGDTRRLMYGLDARVGRPTEIAVRVKREAISIVLRNELPQPEQRLFGAIGTLEVLEDAYYPRTWRFAHSRLETVLDALKGLRVRIDQQN